MKQLESSLNLQRGALIRAATPFVLDHGWSEQALSEACLSLGEEARYWGVFFANISDAVDFFAQSEDARMIRVMSDYVELEGTRDKIGKALFERIINISGGTSMLKRLEEFYCTQIPSAIKNIWQTADIIWLFAGDKSTDFNHYTKRTLLSGVYIAVVRHALNVPANHYAALEIQQYIADALDKVVKFGSLKRHFKLPKMEDILILRMFS
jgi:ubiquinone biosynthesis protein COQ9